MTLLETLNIEDVMTDEGYGYMCALVRGAQGIIENVTVEFDKGCMRLECQVAPQCKEFDSIEDVLWGLIDIINRELVFGWDLIEDASVVIYGTSQEYNLVSADLCYLRKAHLIRVGVLKRGKKNAVIYEYEV